VPKTEKSVKKTPSKASTPTGNTLTKTKAAVETPIKAATLKKTPIGKSAAEAEQGEFLLYGDEYDSIGYADDDFAYADEYDEYGNEYDFADEDYVGDEAYEDQYAAVEDYSEQNDEYAYDESADNDVLAEDVSVYDGDYEENIDAESEDEDAQADEIDAERAVFGFGHRILISSTSFWILQMASICFGGLMVCCLLCFFAVTDDGGEGAGIQSKFGYDFEYGFNSFLEVFRNDDDEAIALKASDSDSDTSNHDIVDDIVEDTDSQSATEFDAHSPGHAFIAELSDAQSIDPLIRDFE